MCVVYPGTPYHTRETDGALIFLFEHFFANNAFCRFASLSIFIRRPFVRGVPVQSKANSNVEEVRREWCVFFSMYHLLFASLMDQLAYIETGLPARSAKISALQNARELCFECESARMTREHGRTKLRRRRRRGAESLRSSHAVDSVGFERRVSPPRRRRAMLTFRPSFPT